MNNSGHASYASWRSGADKIEGVKKEVNNRGRQQKDPEIVKTGVGALAISCGWLYGNTAVIQFRLQQNHSLTMIPMQIETDQLENRTQRGKEEKKQTKNQKQAQEWRLSI